MKNLRYLLILIILCNLSACMTTQAFSPEVKKNIHTISVDNNIKVPDGLYYVGPGFGYVGLLSAIPGISSVDKISRVVHDQNIKINDIVRNHFISDIRRDTQLKVLDGKADAQLHLEVQKYGFTIPHGYSFVVVPIIIVDAKLVQNNKVVWQNYYRVLPLFDSMPAHKPDELINNPELIVSAWNTAAEKVAHTLVQELK